MQAVNSRLHKTGHGEQILVVDDSRETVRHLAETLLPSFGFRASYALDGRSALQKIRDDHPDLVILDLNLPLMTGIDVLQALALEADRPPVILMTGGGSEKSAIEAFRLGVKDYLVKPFTIDEMLSTIQRTLYPPAANDSAAPADEQQMLSAAQNEVRRQQALLATIVQFSRALAGLTDINTLIDHALRAALAQTDAEHSRFWLLDHQHIAAQTFNLARAQTQIQAQRGDDADPYLAQVIANGSPLRLTNFSDGLTVGRPRRARALLYVPLFSHSEIVGVLGVINDHDPHAFSQYDELLLDAIGGFVSIALGNAQTLRVQQAAHLRESQRLQQLTQLNRDLLYLDAEEVIARGLAAVRQQWAIEACSIWTVDGASQTVRFLANNGSGGDVLTRTVLPLGNGFVGYVGESGRWFYSNAVPNHPRHNTTIDAATGTRTHSILCVPLHFRDRLLGVLELVNRADGEFDESDVELALAYGAPLALALHLRADTHAQRQLATGSVEVGDKRLEI